MRGGKKRRKVREREREEKLVTSSRSLVVATELIKSEAWQSTYKISRNVDGYGEGFYYFVIPLITFDALKFPTLFADNPLFLLRKES